MTALLDGLVTYTTEAAIQGAVKLKVVNSVALCAAVATGDYAYLKLSSGATERTVKVVSCTGGDINLATGLDASFPAGSCLRFVLTTQIVCEMIAAGGCVTAVAAASCTPVKVLAGAVIPDIVVGELFEWVIALSGTAPFSVSALIAPSWMNISPIGATNTTSILLSGTPPDGTALSLQILVTGCNGSSVMIVQRLCYCYAAGVLPPP